MDYIIKLLGVYYERKAQQEIKRYNRYNVQLNVVYTYLASLKKSANPALVPTIIANIKLLALYTPARTHVANINKVISMIDRLTDNFHDNMYYIQELCQSLAISDITTQSKTIQAIEDDCITTRGYNGNGNGKGPRGPGPSCLPLSCVPKPIDFTDDEVSYALIGDAGDADITVKKNKTRYLYVSGTVLQPRRNFCRTLAISAKNTPCFYRCRFS
ncbi:hypothetical protein BgiBS90_028890 [Biomphalaria glabrata]|nr:hypothetical protein BgiBS90_028890 [Biomphalaria glabrata]